MWVPTRPLVVKPQTKKVPARSQKSRLSRPSFRPLNAVLSGLALLRHGDGHDRYRAERRLRRHRRAIPAIATTPAESAVARQTATTITTGFQPPHSWMADKAGKKINVPVEVEAASNPITSPRWVTNQRLTMVADSTLATQPLPMPEITPHSRINCQGAVITETGQGRAAHQGQREQHRVADAEALHRRRREGTGKAIRGKCPPPRRRRSRCATSERRWPTAPAAPPGWSASPPPPAARRKSAPRPDKRNADGSRA